MSIIHKMMSVPAGKCVKGSCAKCKATVYEDLWLLDDAYNVWVGECPHCGAHNLLAMTGLRGYSSAGMNLVLPTDEEIAANADWGKDWPTSGPCGKAADQHGTVAGELYHKLRGE